MIRIAVVEDNQEYSDRLVQYLNKFAEENERRFEITVFHDGMDLMKIYKSSWDIIFMDIEMPLLDGMAAAKEIRKSDPVVIIIFVTQMAQYAVKGYEVDAMDFILKPVNYFPFTIKLQKALSIIENRKQDVVFLPTTGVTKRVPVNDILYIEVADHQLHFHTVNGTVIISGTLKQWEEKLRPMHFSRCNSGYLVNLEKVTGYQKDVVVVGKDTLVVSRPRRKAFFQELSNYIGGMR